jgi:hypothetical protein
MDKSSYSCELVGVGCENTDKAFLYRQLQGFFLRFLDELDVLQWTGGFGRGHHKAVDQ